MAAACRPRRLPCSTASTQAAERHGFGAGECLHMLELGACAFVWLRWWQGIGLEEYRLIGSLNESSRCLKLQPVALLPLQHTRACGDANGRLISHNFPFTNLTLSLAF